MLSDTFLIYEIEKYSESIRKINFKKYEINTEDTESGYQFNSIDNMIDKLKIIEEIK